MMRDACDKERRDVESNEHCDENGWNATGSYGGDSDKRASNYGYGAKPARLSFATTLFDFEPNARAALLKTSSEACFVRSR